MCDPTPMFQATAAANAAANQRRGTMFSRRDSSFTDVRAKYIAEEHKALEEIVTHHRVWFERGWNAAYDYAAEQTSVLRDQRDKDRETIRALEARGRFTPCGFTFGIIIGAIGGAIGGAMALNAMGII